MIFGVFAEGWDLFAFMPFRIYSIMQNVVLMAVPLFIFMGVVLQRTRLAEQLLESMGRLFGDIRDHLRGDFHLVAIEHPGKAHRAGLAEAAGKTGSRALARNLGDGVDEIVGHILFQIVRRRLP
mgnify:CR=1 FL=1